MAPHPKHEATAPLLHSPEDLAPSRTDRELAHDLRNLVLVIEGYAELLGQEQLERSAKKKYCGVIERSCQRMGKLIALLDARGVATLGLVAPAASAPPPGAGRTALPDEEPLDQVLRECVGMHQVQARGQQVVMSLHLDRRLGDKRIAGTPLSRIVCNLLSNAIQCSRPGGEVSLSAQLGHSTLTIKVQDQGPGIPAHEEEMAFTWGWRGSLGGAAREPGKGLGLAIVKQLIEGLGGDVSVSPNPGGGAVFTMTLPC